MKLKWKNKSSRQIMPHPFVNTIVLYTAVVAK